MAQTCALIARVQLVLQRVSCRNETLPNAPKHYETHQNMSLGSNGVDQERLLPNILTWFRGTNFCISRTSSAHFEPSFIRRWNGPKCTQTVRNTSKHEFRVQWGGSGAFVAKNYKVTSWDELSCTYETMPNAPKFYELHRNISIGSNGMDWVHLLQKNPNVTSWHELLL